jgi:hypothetical protein
MNSGPESCSPSQRFVLLCGGRWQVGHTLCCQLSLPFQGLSPHQSLGTLSLRLQSLEGYLGQEAGKQGYSSENGRTLGALHWNIIWSQHTQRELKPPSACVSAGPGPPSAGVVLGLL